MTKPLLFSLIFFLFLGFWSIRSFGQKYEMQKDQPVLKERKYTIKQDVVYNDVEENPSFMFDIEFGLGVGEYGISAIAGFNVDVKHILVTARVYSQGFMMTSQLVNERSILLGYRFRNEKRIWALSAGYGRASFKCTSGLNFNCYNYVDETVGIFPVSAEYAFDIRDSFGMAVMYNISFNNRDINMGVVFVFKFGYLGGINK